MPRILTIEIEDCNDCSYSTNVTLKGYYIAGCKKANRELPWNNNQYPQHEYIPDWCPLPVKE